MRVLFVGDIFGNPGLAVLEAYLERFKDDYDLIIANGENAAGGFGLTRKTFGRITEAGVDVVTLGNHTWDKEEVTALLEETPRLIRPLNYTPGVPGLGYTSVEARSGERVTVAQAMGRIFMPPTDNPFAALDALADEVDETLIVDVHAEATSEKRALGHLLAGRAAAVLGTHTHVQTADEMIKKGTAYITDVGMTGVFDSAIGLRFDEVVYRFRTGLPKRYKPADKPGTLCAVALQLEAKRATHIERIQWVQEA